MRSNIDEVRVIRHRGHGRFDVAVELGLHVLLKDGKHSLLATEFKVGMVRSVLEIDWGWRSGSLQRTL